MRSSRFKRWSIFAAATLLAAVLFAGSPADTLKGGDQPPPASPTDAPPPANDTPPAAPAAPAAAPAPSAAGPFTVYVIPITEAISKPNEYILRRGIKAAIENDIDVVILEIDTPGGRGDVMLEIMERIFNYTGITIAFVNNEAISAGAFISFSADEIWYAPDGVIGSAAVVSGGGQEIPETMKQKIDSYIMAKARSMSHEHPYKAKVMRAMMDANYVLEIDGEVLKEEGELLALTADEAMKPYGRPPTPLFGEGIATDVDNLLDQRFGSGNYEVTRFSISWSEELAKYMDSIAPILLGLGFLLIFIEFKTPGFGVFGITGIILVGIVFLSNYVAGLAGYEPIIVFVIGLALVAVEIFFFPGTFVFLIVGFVLAFGAILWSMADIWPTSGGGIDVRPEDFIGPLYDLSLGIIVCAVSLALVWRYLPRTALYRRLVLQSATAPVSDVLAHGGSSSSAALPDIGTVGVAVNTLRPTGQVEIGGKRFEASASFGTLEKGTRVVVTGYRNFYLLVDKSDS